MIPSTGIPLLDWFLALLDAWGYLLVFGFTVFENLFVIGSLTPGETVVIAAAAVAANGQLQLVGVWIVSVVGTVVGSNLSYLLGRRSGLDGVRAFAGWAADTRIGRILRLDDESVDDVYEHFHQKGARTVFISRFAIGAKNFVPAVAGATHMPVFWFELYTLLGAIVYTSLMCAIGWFLGANLETALQVASGIGYVGLAILASLIFLAWYGRRRYKQRKTSHSAEDPE
jgi:membrane protein DedA with SNARE-associated domain